MTKFAGLAAQAVDIKNDPQHKGFIRVTLHVPVEQGPLLTDALGWPTMAAPVPVALAKLNLTEKEAPAQKLTETNATVTEKIAAGSSHLKADRFSESASPAGREPHLQENAAPVSSRLIKQAAICCNDPRFWAFLTEKGMPTNNISTAKMAIYLACLVSSRKEFIPGTPAGDRWEGLYDKYIVWRDAPEQVA